MTRRVLPTTLTSVIAAAAAGGLVAAAAPVAASAAPTPAVSGGTTATAKVCGTTRVVRRVAAGAAVRFTVPAARQARVRAARAGSTVVVERCEAGRWTALRTLRLGARATALSGPLTGASDTAADLRVRVRSRGGAFGRAAHVRVGVGEVVDVPVSFRVVNRNRTALPCLGAPDGKTYTVRGTLVGPRAVLDAGKAAATLYLHGLGYSGDLFFRFRDVPGYDYPLQQAQAGHVSVVVDRLGNPAHDDLPDGNATCFPAQADMADQMVRHLRAGTFDAPGAARRFDRVVLAGHSAGGLITELTQHAFKSADAIAVIGYTDTPSPLTLATFAVAGGDCLTAPQRARGVTGAPGYAPFGRTNADFAAGHFHDIDPTVVKLVLARHNRDACGDLLGALQSLAGNVLLTRTITAPVLIISGSRDALFAPPTNTLAAATAFTGSPDVALVELPGTGHAVTLGRTREAFRSAMDAWLARHGA
ncbi:hypothetical protein DSM112329_01005 [Paraconexibacter sp. AEG42_29]|uniref:AB hydrolase-1 domain-containing protein n=1 Tax=Paraconexibacter sp. AEG42_29 TaxID=2997339 RepID=A0AAU7ARB6_9ACTN